MKYILSRTRALLVGVVLIVATNAVVLGGVAYNRSGEPESTLQLTERELLIRDWSWPENENSSVDLDLRWRVPDLDLNHEGYSSPWYGALPWVTPAQLQELGFDASGDIETEKVLERLQRQPSRRAWFVLEYDGAAYSRQLEGASKRLQRAEALAEANAGDREFQARLANARAALTAERQYSSRLFVVDSAPTAADLRARYPDRRRYAIVRGSMSLSIDGQPGHRRLGGRIHKIDVDAIRVPHTFREVVEPFAESGYYYQQRAPRFAATVNFGQRFEPWIVALVPLSSEASASISR